MSVNKYNSTTGNLERLDGYTVDSTPTSGSGNPVSSGGVYSALDGKVDKIGINGTRPIMSLLRGSDGGNGHSYTFDYSAVPETINGINAGRFPIVIKSTDQGGGISEFLLTLSADSPTKIYGNHSITNDKTNKKITVEAGSNAWGCAIIEGSSQFIQYITVQ